MEVPILEKRGALSGPTRILVTGGDGFVGSHLLPCLARRFPHAEIDPASGPGQARGLDVSVPEAVIARVRAFKPDACVHLAAVAAPAVAGRDPDLAWRVNLSGALNLGRALQREVPRCVMLFASSADAYGASFRSGDALDESAPLAPLNVYGATKAAADLALGAMAGEGLRVIRVRPFNHTGRGQSADFVVPAFARQIAAVAAGRAENVLRVGDLGPWRDFLDVRDVCEAYAACLAAADILVPEDGRTSPIFNLASGTPRRIGDVLTDMLALAGVEAHIETDPERLRPSDIPRAAGESGLARRVLRWAPRIPWQQTLADVLEDWRERL